MLHSAIFSYISQYLTLHGTQSKINIFTYIIFVKLKNILGHSCLAALLTQRFCTGLGRWMYCTGVVHFANRHACVTFWTHSCPATGNHSCPATGNSKPDGPYQPACVRSVTSGLQSVRLCTASASWCWRNGWHVRQKLNPCLLRRHDHTKVTWSSWLPFMISFFIWPWRRSRIL